MNEQIKAGSDIHAGDGGYSIGTKEKYDEFVKVRNKSLAESRIKELAVQAGFVPEADWDGMLHFDKEKFADLIVRECAEICLEMAAKCAGLPGDGALAKDCAYWIKNDFGVEE